MNKRCSMAKASVFLALAFVMIVILPLRADARSEYTLELGGGTLGSIGYMIMNGTAELINKNSSWLRARFTETAGGSENLRTVAEEPAKRKTNVFYSELFTIRQAVLGVRPFREPYTGNRIVAKMTENVNVLLTLDPQIKRVEDLVGKKIAVGQKGISIYWHTYLIMKEGHGIWDKLKPEYLNFNESKDALINGLIDVACQGGAIIEAGESPEFPKVAAPTSQAAELVERYKPYVVSLEKEAIDRAREKSGYPLYWISIPAGTYGPNQPKPAGSESYVMTWNCDMEMPDDVVYEITSIIYENCDKFKNYHATGKGITRANMTLIPGATEKDFHPGAVRFYKEKGMKIGVPVGK